MAYLAKAELAARRLPTENGGNFPPNPRQFALENLALAYAEAGDADKGMKLGEAFSDNSKAQVAVGVSCILVEQGDVERAIRIAKKANALPLIVGLIAKTDLLTAMKLCDDVPESWRPRVYNAMVQRAILQENFDVAEEALSRIPDNAADQKAEAKCWFSAGRVVTSRNMKEAQAASTQPAEKLEANLGRILCEKARAGDTKRAEAILDLLRTPELRAQALIDIAGGYRAKGDKQSCRQYITQALKEVRGIKDPSGLGAFRLASMYLGMAYTLAQIGDMEEAVSLIKAAQTQGEKEELGLFKALGGTNALLALYVQAGKMDEAIKLATRKDNTLSSDAIPLLVEGFIKKGLPEEAAKLIDGAKTSEEQFWLDLAAARAALATKR